jgi:hypothetical protein
LLKLVAKAYKAIEILAKYDAKNHENVTLFSNNICTVKTENPGSR